MNLIRTHAAAFRTIVDAIDKMDDLDEFLNACETLHDKLFKAMTEAEEALVQGEVSATNPQPDLEATQPILPPPDAPDEGNFDSHAQVADEDDDDFPW